MRTAFSSRLAWLALLTVLVGWGLGEWPAERTGLTLLLAYLPPLIWLLPAGLALLWTAFRRRGWGVALLTLWVAAWGAGLLHWRPQSAAGEWRILTYNVARGTQGTSAEILKTLRQSDADVILLQETNFIPAGYGEALLKGLPGYEVRRGHEVWTLSRWPVASTEQFAIPGSPRTLLKTELRRPDGQKLTVVNAHLHTVLVSSALRGDWETVNRTAKARSWEVGELCRIAGQVSGPLLVGGDLNTPPRGRLYRRLNGCIGPDAHDRGGRGPGWTFPRLFLRIDHLFSRGLEAQQAHVVTAAQGSDHLPLLVEYR